MRRAQLVVTAAAVVALALLPVLATSLQLGYAADVDARAGDPLSATERALDRAATDAAADVPGRFGWNRSDDAAALVRGRLSGTLAALNGSRVATAVELEYDDAAARRAARLRCPGGPNRSFGACEAIDGVVVQNRSGRTHVVAVAVRAVVSDPGARREATFLLRP
jgi:hypothetical protein